MLRRKINYHVGIISRSGLKRRSDNFLENVKTINPKNHVNIFFSHGKWQNGFALAAHACGVHATNNAVLPRVRNSVQCGFAGSIGCIEHTYSTYTPDQSVIHDINKYPYRGINVSEADSGYSIVLVAVGSTSRLGRNNATPSRLHRYFPCYCAWKSAGIGLRWQNFGDTDVFKGLTRVNYLITRLVSNGYRILHFDIGHVKKLEMLKVMPTKVVLTREISVKGHRRYGWASQRPSTFFSHATR